MKVALIMQPFIHISADNTTVFWLVELCTSVIKSFFPTTKQHNKLFTNKLPQKYRKPVAEKEVLWSLSQYG